LLGLLSKQEVCKRRRTNGYPYATGNNE